MTLATRMRTACRALLLLGLPAIAAAQPDPAEAEPAGPPVYRLEMIVFEYPEGRSDARPAPAPLDFTRLPDPRLLAAATRAVEAHLTALKRALPMLPDPAGDRTAAWLENDEERIEPAPEPYLAGAPLSAPMRDALERLGASPDHLLVASLAWIQPAGRNQRTRTLRVHNQQVVDWIEPAAPPPGLFFPDPEQIERALADAGAAMASATGAAGARINIPGLPRPPPPRPVYRIDGGAHLARGQFFRLRLDLALQQRAEPARLPGTESRSANAAEWVLHRLDQTRAIRPDRFEYFDSSRFGVLARLTRFDRFTPPPEPEPEPDPGADDVQPSGAANAAILFDDSSDRDPIVND